ncbi:phosphomannomutase [Candidatus Nitrosotenuis uzonensis]|uniref:phosphomannomutase n=1 Tax=Candidatus Nitrosotenuis uzonensis TaxID=1407055 RepID=UPI00064F0BB3|nr:phosphomannomutase [Candidatus Nitrosotenuis uzonensis]
MKKSISGIRGIFGEDLTLIDILRFCSNFAPMIKSGKCVVANDTRPSSDVLRETAIASLLAGGIDVYNLGMAPTPVVFREARKYGAGLIITSSHNPLKWNGLKFIINGRGPNEKEFAQILKEKKPSKTKIGKEFSATSNYAADAASIIGKVSHRPKIAIDIGGGAAAVVAPAVLEKIGCHVHIINQNKSMRGADPTSDKLSQLVAASKRSDIGFAFDLDGDRLVVVKDGKKQSPDTTLALGIPKALELGYKKFCLSIDTSIAVEKYIQNNGGTVVRSKVGEANVIDTMLKKNCKAGGEGSSGGFILPEFNMCRDGILTSGLIAAMTGKKIVDEIISFVSNYTQLRTKIDAQSHLHDKVLEKFEKNVRSKFSEIITIDGVKIIVDENTWSLVRKSNTEDIIRISVESNNIQKAKQIQKEITSLVKQSYDQIR